MHVSEMACCWFNGRLTHRLHLVAIRNAMWKLLTFSQCRWTRFVVNTWKIFLYLNSEHPEVWGCQTKLLTGSRALVQRGSQRSRHEIVALRNKDRPEWKVIVLMDNRPHSCKVSHWWRVCFKVRPCFGWCANFPTSSTSFRFSFGFPGSPSVRVLLWWLQTCCLSTFWTVKVWTDTLLHVPPDALKIYPKHQQH